MNNDGYAEANATQNFFDIIRKLKLTKKRPSILYVDGFFRRYYVALIKPSLLEALSPRLPLPTSISVPE